MKFRHFLNFSHVVASYWPLSDGFYFVFENVIPYWGTIDTLLVREIRGKRGFQPESGKKFQIRELFFQKLFSNFLI